jgi:5-methyltetrahydropteroyltriglutamate--homocysteine methyltransferase
MRRGVEAVVEQQLAAGIDIVSDGETGKISYATYIRHRLSGFDGDSPRPTPRDLDDYPAFRDRLVAEGASPTYRRPVCRGPVGVKNLVPLETDILRLTQALGRADVADGFMTAVSPGTIAVFHPNEYYRTHEDYIGALAGAMRHEYRRIVESGLVLQIDCPDLAMGRHSRFSQLSDAEFLRHAEIQIEALNEALAGLPPERMRLHICWGNYEGPHTHDLPVTKVIDIAFKARIQAISIEAANPRHEHEWEDLKQIRIPDDRILIPGVIDSTTNFVEHPRLVAQRIARYTDIVGRERVIAGVDCGFGTAVRTDPVVADSIVWAKLKALGEGAAIASQRLWGSKAA